MKGEVLVTVVGPTKNNPGKLKVTLGDRVLLKKEPTNEYDSHAIHVFTENGESVGYVGNNEKLTVAPGTLSATKVYGMFGDEAYGFVVDSVEVLYKNGKPSRAFVVALVENQEVQNKNTEQKLTFKLVGSKTMYPNKFRLAEEIKSGNTPLVKLFVQGDKIVAEFEGALCGYVDNKKAEGLSDYEDILSAVNSGNEKIAKITKVVGTSFIGEIYVNKAELERVQNQKCLQEVVEDIIKKGLATEEEIQERMEYLKACGVTDKQILGVFRSYKSYDAEVAKRIPAKPKTLYRDGSGIVKRVIAYINMRRNLLFEGDRGVGKNVLIETLAWIYKRPLYEFSLNSQHDNNSLLGGKTIETDESGRTVMGFDKESIVEAAEVGGILVLDEFNTALSHVMSLLNALLDDRRRLQVPGYKLVEADENFVAIATQNRDYQGTFENNEATIDRFVPIIFPKLENLADVLMAKVPVSYNVIETCEKLFKGIRKCVEDGEISERAITVRGFIDACLAVQMDIPLKEALIDNIANRSSDLDDRKTIQNMIEDILG